MAWTRVFGILTRPASQLYTVCIGTPRQVAIVDALTPLRSRSERRPVPGSPVLRAGETSRKKNADTSSRFTCSRLDNALVVADPGRLSRLSHLSTVIGCTPRRLATSPAPSPATNRA